ncbi:MAG: PDZ domain-containing protein [Fibrobacter sp.]|nr:PDZ domain-containing protein [Fibrobacter sp.]
MNKITIIVPLLMSAAFASEQFGGVGVSISGNPYGVTVIDVVPGSPASEAGVEAGDILFAIDGLRLSAFGLEEATESLRGTVGKPMELSAIRGMDTISFTVRRIGFSVNQLDSSDIAEWYANNNSVYSAEEIAEIADARLLNNQKLLSVQQNGKTLSGDKIQLHGKMVSIAVNQNVADTLKVKKFAEKVKAAKLVHFSREILSFELFNAGTTIVRIVKTDGGVNKKLVVKNALKGLNSFSWDAESVSEGNYLIHIEQNGASSAFNVQLK